MARNVAAAINQRKMLRIARMIHGQPQGVAIFVMESIEGASGREAGEDIETSCIPRSGSAESNRRITDRWLYENPTYIFTAFCPKREGSGTFDPNDIDRHVSMEVDTPDLGGQYQRRPRLFTKRWIHGVCFFYGCPQQDVVFPWPASLQGLCHKCRRKGCHLE